MKIDLVMANVFKFVTFVLFTFMVLVYFGFLLLLPLDVLAQLIKILSGIGLPTVLAAALSVGAVGYLGYAVYRMPDLYKLVIDIGMELISFAYAQIKRFDPLIELARSEANKNPSTA